MTEEKGITGGRPGAGGKERVFLDGSRRGTAALRTAVVGVGEYRPGWRWSVHAKPQTGKEAERHIGYIVAGAMVVSDGRGNEERMEAGMAFEIEPGGDAWVVGEGTCVALDFTPTGGTAGATAPGPTPARPL